MAENLVGFIQELLELGILGGVNVLHIKTQLETPVKPNVVLSVVLKLPIISFFSLL